MKSTTLYREMKALFFGFSGVSHEPSFAIDPMQLALATLVINLLSLALPLTAMQVYDRIIARNAIATLDVLAVGVLLAVLLEALLRTLRAWLTGWLGASREHDLYRAAIEHVLRKDLRQIEQRGAAYNAEEVASIGRLREFYSGQALITLVDLPFILVFLGLTAYLGHALVWVPVLLLLTFCLRAWCMGGRLKNVLGERERYDEERYDFIVEALGGIHTLKAFGAEEAMMRRYETLEARSAVANLAVAHASGDAYNDGGLFSQLMSVSVLVIGAYMAVGGAISMGTLVACVLLAGRMMQPVQRALSLWSRFQSQRVAREKVEGLFGGLPSYALPFGHCMPADEAVLSAHGLGFGFERGTRLLQDCSLTIAPGHVVSISGASGSGKSTLLKILAGLYPPSEGQVLLDGRSLCSLDPVERAAHVGYLATDSTIFQGSIRDNLTGFGAVPEFRMLEIARLLHIDAEVVKLPAGYDTLLENTPADPIAPGMKQRITLARALAHKPHLLLFDHADRALDRDGYHHIYRLLARLKGQVAMVIVSNDPHLRRLADEHYVLQHGRLEIDADPILASDLIMEHGQ